MKALFVFPSSSAYGVNEATEQPPLGIAYLAAILEKNGFICEVLDANFLGYTEAQTVAAVKRSGADVVGLSLYAFNFKSGLSLAGSVKAVLPDTVVIAGGAHSSALGSKVLEKCRSVDAVIIGEGETAILEIMKNLKSRAEPFKSVDGAVYRSNDSIVSNNIRAPIEDLDELPFPAFHLYPDLSRYQRRAAASPAVPILTSRGCPFECVFCSKCVFGRDVRYRSADNVIAEIDYMVGRFGARQIDIVDDNFITDKQRAANILVKLCERPYRLAINLQSGVSATLVDPEMLKLMKDAGVYRIAFGVESGNEDILCRIKKRQKLDDIMRAVGLAKKNGIRADAFFMIGLPGESEATMQDTIDFAKRLDPHTANFHMVVPFPGTELYDTIKRSGRLLRPTEDGIASGYNFPEAFYELEGLTKDAIEKYYKKAYREFYFRPGKIMQTIVDIRSPEEFVWLCRTAFTVMSSFVRKRDHFEKRPS